MEATGAKFDISHISDDTPIDLYQIEILHRLQTDGPTNLVRIFEGRASRLVMVGLFLAILELIRSQLVHAEQSQTDSSATTNSDSAIYLRAMTQEPAEEAVRKVISAIETAEAANSTSEITEKKITEEKPAIPIAEIPADEKKQSAQEFEPTGGESQQNQQ